MNSSKIRTAIVGTGVIAQNHLGAIHSNPDLFDLRAVCDVDPAKAEAFRQVAKMDRCYHSMTELLEQEDLDLVQICTPPASHVPLSIQAMEAGLNVVCEKPLCGSLADFHRLAEVEQRTGKWCASVFQFRYGSGTRHLLDLVQRGLLGRHLVGVCHTLWYRSKEYYDLEWRGTWKSELGGPTAGHGIHAMDHFLMMMGEWSEVRADMGTLDRPIEVEDVSMATVRFQNGALGSIVNSILSPRQVTYHRLDFQKATVEVEHLYSYENGDWIFTPVEGSSEEFTETLRAMPEGNRSDHTAQMKALAEDMRAGRRPLTSGVHAEATLDLLSSLYKSALTGQVVARGSIREGDPFYSCFHGGKSISHRLIKSQKGSSLEAANA